MKQITIIIYLFLVGCTGDPKINYSSEILIEILSDCYKNNSQDDLIKFLEIWKSEIAPVQNDTLDYKHKQIYSLFSAIYNPTEYVDKYKTYYFKDYSKSNYLVLQSSLSYRELPYIAESSLFLSRLQNPEFSYKEFTEMAQFYPKSNFNSERILFLNKKYEDVLNRFIFGRYADSVNLMRYNFLSDSTNNAVDKKLRFLRKKINVAHQHWSMGLWYNSFPRLEYILFAKDYKKAIVNKRNFYASGTEDEYHFINDKWIYADYLGSWEE